MTLTGKKRYRSERKWGRERLILQVEFTTAHMKDLNGSGYYDEWTTTHWRDATTADLTTEQSA